MASLKLSGVAKKYAKTTILPDVNLEIEDGEFVVLVGPSGSGKSTLLRIIAGLETLDAGSVFSGDLDISDALPRDRNMAMVFQSYALYPHMDVYANMAMSLKIKKVDAATIEKKVLEVANLLEIGHLLNRKPAELSGGQRQRVAMGRALVRNPQVFLFDEPLSNLDAKLRAYMRTEIKKLHRKLQITMVYVTHDQTEAMTLADRIVVLNGGHIEQHGTPFELFSKPANLFVAGFIGTPEMNIFDARLDEGRLFALGSQLDFCEELVQAGYGDQKIVKVGVRPGSMRGAEGPVLKAEGQVEIIELLGSDMLVELSFEEPQKQSLFVLLSYDDSLRVGDKKTVEIPKEDIHLFDAKTGKRLLN